MSQCWAPRVRETSEHRSMAQKHGDTEHGHEHGHGDTASHRGYVRNTTIAPLLSGLMRRGIQSRGQPGGASHLRRGLAQGSVRSQNPFPLTSVFRESIAIVQMGDWNAEFTPHRLFWKSIAPAKTVKIPQHAVPVSRAGQRRFHVASPRRLPPKS